LLNPNHTGSQEIKAVALEEIGARDKALEEYESLYLKHSNSIQYLFKMTVLQVDLKRYKEAKTNADILLSKKTIDSLEIDMPKGENETQPVSMKACLYNLKGLIEQGQGNNDEAKKQFDAALQMNPDFYLARQNLDAMLKSEK
jgi:tetratricopeptide (TPR) repeat protein